MSSCCPNNFSEYTHEHVVQWNSLPHTQKHLKDKNTHTHTLTHANNTRLVPPQNCMGGQTKAGREKELHRWWRQWGQILSPQEMVVAALYWVNVTCAWQNKSLAWGWLIWPKIVPCRSCSETFTHQEVDRKTGNQLPSRGQWNADRMWASNSIVSPLRFEIPILQHRRAFRMRISASMACCHGHATMRAENAAGYEAEGEEEGDYRVYPAIIKPNGLWFKYCLSFLDLMAPMVLLGMFQRMSRAFCFCFVHCTISHPLFWFSHPHDPQLNFFLLIALFFKARELEGQVKQLNRKIQVQTETWNDDDDIDYIVNLRNMRWNRI